MRRTSSLGTQHQMGEPCSQHPMRGTSPRVDGRRTNPPADSQSVHRVTVGDLGLSPKALQTTAEGGRPQLHSRGENTKSSDWGGVHYAGKSLPSRNARTSTVRGGKGESNIRCTQGPERPKSPRAAGHKSGEQSSPRSYARAPIGNSPSASKDWFVHPEG